MSKKSQITFKIDQWHVDTIDEFIKPTGLTRSKFIELMVLSAAESIRSICTTQEVMEYDEVAGMELPTTVRGAADMHTAREIITSLFKIKETIGDDDENAAT